MAMTTRAQTLDSIPTDNPERIVVAGPPRVESTISLTGERLVDVKYDVNGLYATAKPTPIAVSAANLQSCAYQKARAKAHMIVFTLDTSYERNIASSASCARKNFIGNRSQIGTVKVPRIELRTPIARMING